jgi:hypothetical protein
MDDFFKNYDDIYFFKNYKDEFKPRMGLKNRYIISDPQSGTFLINHGGSIYLVEVILRMDTCYRIKFLERLPKDLEDISIGDKEVWIPKERVNFIEPIDKDHIRTLKINSLGDL